jgi:hypothetical protein
MTLAATVQRSRLYKPKLSEADRKEFQKSLKTELESLAKKYTKHVNDEKHIDNISGLSELLSTKHKRILNGSKMKFGHAQKALNLYLKYLWCLGKLGIEPPHFPIDSIILKKIPGYTQIRWTKLNDIDLYRSIIATARIEAKNKNLTLARWELIKYNTANT